ncbi:MAG: DUF5666 domain-containing protein [Betaproteobacteria bacterium]
MNVASFRKSMSGWVFHALVATAPLLLAACGGGEQVAAGGIVGTGISISSVGSVSALGPDVVTVNGINFAAKTALVRVNGEAATQAALKVGLVVTIQGQTLADGTAVAQSIDSRVEVKGVVSGVDMAARSFTVLGQRVFTDQLTVFGGGSFATLLNQYVEVSGFRAAPGDVLATRVDIIATSVPGATLEVTGVVSAFDPVGKTFMIGAQLVDFSQVGAAFVSPGLANGVIADVHGTMVNTGGRLIAAEIYLVVTTIPGPENSSVEMEGVITNFTGLAGFRVNGQLVDGRGATVTGGSAAMIVDGAKIEVEGTLMQGVVVASKIEIEQEAEIALDATVEAVDQTGITLGGQRYLVTSTTQFEDRSAAAMRDFGLAAVRVGDRLLVDAVRSATGLSATRVVRVDLQAASGSDSTTEVEGAITEFVSIASFKVAGQSINASSAKIEGGVAGDLVVGRRVDVEGVLAGNVLLATRVVVEPADAPPTASVAIEGLITGFVSQANFKVSGQVVDATQSSFEGGIAADLANGRSVAVQGVVIGGVVAASKVSFKSASSESTLEVEGSITAFSSIANFKVAGQSVDASSARISNGTAADLANGRRVGVVGPVANGVLRAATVEIKDAPELIEAGVRGTITNFVSVSNFVVAARKIDASKATFEHGGSANLANGVQVEIEGKLVGNVLVADKVAFD